MQGQRFEENLNNGSGQLLSDFYETLLERAVEEIERDVS